MTVDTHTHLRHETDTSKTRARAARRKPHVLLIEDDDELRERYRATLESAGYHVTELPDGTSARGYFEDCLLHEQPRAIVDCIVSDLRMPGCDGLDVVQAIEDLGRHVPTVVVTDQGGISPSRSAA